MLGSRVTVPQGTISIFDVIDAASVGVSGLSLPGPVIVALIAYFTLRRTPKCAKFV